ncbi:serine-enriched protein-like protein, partial [Dinothrombium tinctorium]
MAMTVNSLNTYDCDDLTDHECETDYSVYENKTGLAEDMKFLASMPELCDITFLIGETREPSQNVSGSSQPSSNYSGGNSSTTVEGSSTITAVESSEYTITRERPPLKHSKSKKIKETSKDNKLKLFLKRSSEPLLNGLPFNQQQPSVQTHQTMIIEEFEPDVFRQLIEYIHTGCVTLQARTLL